MTYGEARHPDGRIIGTLTIGNQSVLFLTDRNNIRADGRGDRARTWINGNTGDVSRSVGGEVVETSKVEVGDQPASRRDSQREEAEAVKKAQAEAWKILHQARAPATAAKKAVAKAKSRHDAAQKALEAAQQKAKPEDPRSAVRLTEATAKAEAVQKVLMELDGVWRQADRQYGFALRGYQRISYWRMRVSASRGPDRARRHPQVPVSTSPAYLKAFDPPVRTGHG